MWIVVVEWAGLGFKNYYGPHTDISNASRKAEELINKGALSAEIRLLLS